MSPDFPGESPGIVWSPAKWTDSALASVSMGYQVGVTPLQMVAAVSSVANGGELVEPRVIRAIYRDNRRYAVQPKIVRRTISADTAATLTDDHGRGRRPRHREAGADARLHDRRQDRHRREAGERPLLDQRLQRVVRRVRAVARSGGRDHRRHRLAARTGRRHTGGAVSAPIFKRIAEATLRYLGVGPTINPPPPVLVARQDESPVHTPTGHASANEPVVSLVADGPPGTVPDLRGMSAREAVRKLVKLGMNARVSGDGFVVSQDAGRRRADRRRRAVPPRARTMAVAPCGDCEPSMTWAELHGALHGRGLIRADDALRAEAAVGAVTGVAYDSRAVTPGQVFVALKGQHADGTSFARQAIERGAAAVVSEQAAPDGVHVPWAIVEDARLALAVLAAAFYRDPSREMRVVGITGTNGKTTTAYLVAVDLRGRRDPLRHARHRRAIASATRSAKRRARRPKRRRCRRCCARWSTAVRRLRDGGVVARAVAAPRRRHHVSPPASSRT